ncbi:MAG TPA: DUF354 domain-containing protein [Bacteroidales bacterium]|nr:DUF354 domain-containing protein [Bacteroidales bacterium]HRZ49952.1 DUF354 domain-containing protein [Bacteroidales bacterium]
MKKILIETGHPGQVHQFRHIAVQLISRGHQVLFVTRSKPLCIELLKAFNLPYTVLAEQRRDILTKLLQLPRLYLRYLMILIRFKPSLILNRFTPQGCHLGWLLRIPVIGFTDSEHTRLMDAITVPFTKVKITALSYWKDLGYNHLRYNGNIELFYLHPNHFTPDPSIYRLMGIAPDTPFAILRFVSWDAYHDLGQQGLNLSDKQELVAMLASGMRVFITSESPLPPEFEPYRISFPPEKIHDALAFAQLYIGEGATMASEAALLGTPAIYVNSLTAGSIEDAAEAGLIRSFRNRNGVAEAVREWMQMPGLKEKHLRLRDDYIRQKVDMVPQITRFVEMFPESLAFLQQNPHLWQTNSTDQ